MKLIEKLKEIKVKKDLEALKMKFEGQLARFETFTMIYNRGIDYFHKRHYREALECFRNAVEKNPQAASVYYNLALAYQYLEDYDNAYINYNKFLEMKPNDYEGLYNLALVYYTQENYDKALGFFQKCFDIKKEDDCIKAIALCYLSLGQEDKIFILAQQIFEGGESVKLYYTIAKVLETQNPLDGDFKFVNKAIEMYKNILDRKAEDLEAYLSISICYAKKNEWENALEYCKKALNYNPKSYEANNQMGLVNYCCDRLDDAIRFYETALHLKPEGDYRIYSNLAYAYEKYGQKNNALVTFKKLINKFPNCPAKNEIKNHMRIIKSL